MVHLGIQRPLGQGLVQLVDWVVRVEDALRIGAGQQWSRIASEIFGSSRLARKASFEPVMPAEMGKTALDPGLISNSCMDVSGPIETRSRAGPIPQTTSRHCAQACGSSDPVEQLTHPQEASACSVSCSGSNPVVVSAAWGKVVGMSLHGNWHQDRRCWPADLSLPVRDDSPSTKTSTRRSTLVCHPGLSWA